MVVSAPNKCKGSTAGDTDRGTGIQIEDVDARHENLPCNKCTTSFLERAGCRKESKRLKEDLKSLGLLEESTKQAVL